MNSTVDQEDCVNCVYLHIIIMAAIIILPRNYTNAQTMDTTGHSFSCSMGVLPGNNGHHRSFFLMQHGGVVWEQG